jgi:hypothetical protein
MDLNPFELTRKVRSHISGTPSGSGTNHAWQRSSLTSFAVFFLFVAGGFPWRASAEENKIPELTQELFFGEIVYPQDAGEFQFTTGGYFHREHANDWTIPYSFEYGITDRLQIGFGFPVQREFDDDDSDFLTGIGNFEIEAYYNFLNCPCRGRAAGVGLGVGLPSSDVGEDYVTLEPFAVFYQSLGWVDVNLSANLEIADRRLAGEERPMAGEFDFALLKPVGPLVLMLETAVEVDREETSWLIAPAFSWSPVEDFEVSASLPIGLGGDAPDVGVAFLLTWEFGGGDDDDRDDDQENDD